MSGMYDIFKLAMLQENVLVRIRTLAVEYDNQQLTAERFADRTCELLNELQVEVAKLNKTPTEKQG